MTSLPPNADELVSAYLDGEAAPDEVAVVESTPELMAQVDALREVAGLVAAPLSPPPEQKEAHLAAALGAFDALFATENAASQEPAPAAPRLQSVTPPATEPEPAASAPPETVPSLEAAREQRRPRRFNTGVIAAAVAALLLMVGVAALSLGGSSTDDVASTEAEAVSADSASDSVETTAMDDDEEAMIDEAAGALDAEVGGLSDADSTARAEALPAATPPPPAALQAAPAEEADAQDAMADEEEAMDDEEAMEEAAMDEAADEADFAADDSASDGSDPRATYLFGEFETEGALQAELEEFTVPDLEQRGVEIGEGLFLRCQRSIPELANTDTPTLVGDALVQNQTVEVHYLGEADGGATLYIVNPNECAILLTVPIVP